MFEVPEFASRGAAVMLPFTTTWGWVTWALAWRHLDECSVGWQALREDRALRRRFNLGGVYDYATMMEARIAKRPDSWRGIPWSIFSNDGLAVFPPRSLVHNEARTAPVPTVGVSSVNIRQRAACLPRSISNCRYPVASKPISRLSDAQSGAKTVDRLTKRSTG
jgi:hypothetical protein